MSTNRSQYDPNSPRRQPRTPSGGARRRALLHNQSKQTRAADDRRKTAATNDFLVGDQLEPEDILVPNYLTADQRKIFATILEVVLRMKYLRHEDTLLITEFCGFYAQYIDLCEVIADEGLLIEEVDRQGNVKKRVNPLVPIRDKMFNNFFRIAGQIGFTPASRKRMMAAVAKETENEIKDVDPEAEEWDDLLH